MKRYTESLMPTLKLNMENIKKAFNKYMKQISPQKYPQTKTSATLSEKLFIAVHCTLTSFLKIF